MGGATPAADSLNSLVNPNLWPYGRHFLQAALGLTSCINWVESRAGPLNTLGPLLAQMVWSVSR